MLRMLQAGGNCLTALHLGELVQVLQMHQVQGNCLTVLARVVLLYCYPLAQEVVAGCW